MKTIGAHVSASGGLWQAPLNAAAIGATAFALFTKNQRQWTAPPLSAAEIAVDGPAEGLVRFNGLDYPLEQGRVRLPVENPELWSPEKPKLYPFSVCCGAVAVPWRRSI